jgi:cephalosporin hydroxylase
VTEPDTPGSPSGRRAGIEAVGATTLAEHYQWRLDVHLCDSYFGVPLFKFPEDLRVYEHLLELSRVNVIVEIGMALGGSALWFRDRLRTLSSYRTLPGPVRVVTMDIDAGSARSFLGWADPDYASEIIVLEGDIRDPSCVAKIEAHIPEGSRVMVVEDSAHTKETTLAALEHLSHLVSLGSWFVVEDANRDFPELSPTTAEDFGAQVVPAMDEWLSTPAGGEFARRRDVEMYQITSHPFGYMQRVGDARPRPTNDEVAGYLPATREARFAAAFREILRRSDSPADATELMGRWLRR